MTESFLADEKFDALELIFPELLKYQFNELNKSSRGENWNELNKKGADLGRKSTCGKCGYMDHPDGHPE